MTVENKKRPLLSIMSHIHVNELDIQRGKQNSSSQCFVAQSLRRQGFIDIEVDYYDTNVVRVEADCYIYREVNPELARLLADFDGGEIVQPCSIRLD